MIATIIILAIAFYWLGYETNWLTIRLLVGEPAKSKLAEYAVYQALKRGSGQRLRCGTNDGDGSHNYCDLAHYQVYVSPGIDNVLCGWEWLNNHCADMVDYQPKVEMAIGGVRYNMTIKQPAIIKDVMRANHLTKKQKLAYA